MNNFPKFNANPIRSPCRRRPSSDFPAGAWIFIAVYLCAAAFLPLPAAQVRAQSLNSLLNNAPPAKPPSTRFAPAKANPFVQQDQSLSMGVRRGVVVLSNGKVITGQIWTTLRTPFRVWLAGIKQYRDLDIRLIKSIHVKILRAHLIRQWRWQQEGSDIKVYSGLTKPRISFAYRFILLNGKSVTGTLIAPLYVRTANHRYNLLMYKRIEGKIGEKIGGIVYVKSVRLVVTPKILKAAARMTRSLPPVHWRKLIQGIKLINNSVNGSIP